MLLMILIANTVQIFHKKEFRIEKAIKKKRKLYGKDTIIWVLLDKKRYGINE